jgi:hypothetical protein
MKINILTLIGCFVVMSSTAQKITPKPFLQIIKENKLQHKLYPSLAPVIITTAPTVIAAVTDHMPILLLSADPTLYHMPVLKMLPNTNMPNGYPVIKPQP